MKYTYINETMKTELGELLAGDNSEVINATMHECTNAGYRAGIIGGIVAGVIGAVVCMSAKQMRVDFVDKHIRNTVGKITRDVCSSK